MLQRRDRINADAACAKRKLPTNMKSLVPACLGRVPPNGRHPALSRPRLDPGSKRNPGVGVPEGNP